MTQKLVKTMLEGHFEEQAATLIGWPIAWPNVEFTPPKDGRYLMMHIMPVQRQIIDIQAKMKQYEGAVQISVVVPPGDGAQAADAVAQTVTEIFHTDLALFDPYDPGFVLSITSHATIFDGNDFDGGYMVPVSFEYEAH